MSAQPIPPNPSSGSKSESSGPLSLGRYRHYKGREYLVLGIVRHSETQEELVLYQQDYGDRGLWVRPLAMFRENVTVDGALRPRFEFLSAEIHSGPASR